MNSSTNLLCPLCDIVLNNENIVRLNCDPLRHYFCYDCIEKWFITIKYNTNKTIIYNKRECPICRKSNDLLNLLPDKKYEKHVHYEIGNENNIKNMLCNHLLKDGNSKCTNNGKTIYGGYCGIHKKSYKEHKNIEEDNK